MTTPDELRTMLSDCELREQHLTDYERRFLDSIGRQLAEGRTLSTKQIDLLEEVWNKVTSEQRSVRR